jgi:Fe-S-cluster containining protein
LSELLNICLSCGICCDGTIIGFVQLDKEELPDLKKLMHVEEMDEAGFFLEPCENLVGCSCSIYSRRPKQCDTYNCKLLKSVEQNEINFDSAIEVIQRIKHGKADILKKLNTLPFEFKSQSFYFQILELKKILENNTIESLSHDYSELLVDITVLNTLLTKSIGHSLE